MALCEIRRVLESEKNNFYVGNETKAALYENVEWLCRATPVKAIGYERNKTSN